MGVGAARGESLYLIPPGGLAAVCQCSHQEGGHLATGDRLVGQNFVPSALQPRVMPASASAAMSAANT